MLRPSARWLLPLLAACGSAETPEPLLVSAAANLTPAFREIGEAFTAETGIPVTFNFGSSGQLAQQIEQGAPADVFASADVGYVRELVDAGAIDPASVRVYARGVLVVWSRAGDGQPLALEDLAREGVERIAIANPEHAPYGRAAREALQAAGLWDAVRPKLVMGENVQQAFQYATMGDVSAALVPLSLAREVQGSVLVVPDSLHQPLDQAVGIVRDARDPAGARAFIDFLLGQRGRAILRAHRYKLPRGPDPGTAVVDTMRDEGGG